MLSEINRIVSTAPISPEAQAGLAVLVATHFMGSAMAAMRAANVSGPDEPMHVTAEAIMRVVSEGLKAKGLH